MLFLDELYAFRNLDFLKFIKDFYLKNSSPAAALIHQFDPNILRKRGIQLDPLMTNVIDVFGANYIVNANDHIGWNLFFKGYFDVIPVQLAKFIRICGGVGDYIDVGANIGSTSIPVALAGINVFSIEASNSTAAELMKNISLNPGIRVTTINSAVVSKTQLLENKYSTIYRSKGNFGAASLLPNWNASGEQFGEHCINTTLDLIVSHHSIRDILLVKLDIEGYEYFALQGFEDTLNELKPAVLFEWRPDHLIKTLGRVDDLRELFPASYKFFSVQSQIFMKDENVPAFALKLNPANMVDSSDNVLAIDEVMLNHPYLAAATNQFVTF